MPDADGFYRIPVTRARRGYAVAHHARTVRYAFQTFPRKPRSLSATATHPPSTTSGSLTLKVKRTFASDKSTELHFFYTQTHTLTHTTLRTRPLQPRGSRERYLCTTIRFQKAHLTATPL